MAGDGDVKEIVPANIEELRETLLDNQKVRITSGQGENMWLLPEFEGVHVLTKRFQRIVDLRPDDLVVTVKGGTGFGRLLEELEPTGLTLPVARGIEYGFFKHSFGTVGGWLAMGLPHIHQARFGPIRDWVTGMTVMLSNGDVVKMGSTVVKSVAGFDLHRTMVGSRGTLGVILDVTLRLQPISRVGEPDVYVHSVRKKFRYISRVPVAEFEQVVETIPEVVAADCRTGIVWSWADGGPWDKRVVWTMGPGGMLLPGPEESVKRVQRKLKEQFDPRGLFAPGFRDE